MLQQLKTYIDRLNEKKFLMYSSIVLGSLVLLIAFMMTYFFWARANRRNELEEINIERSTQVKRILLKAQQLQKQRQEVDAMLQKDPDFKIGGYVDNVLNNLGLSNKKTMESAPTTTELSTKYAESAIEITLNDINMSQLINLIVEIESEKRVYIKKLEIGCSKMSARALEVNITIATLLLR